MNLSDLRAHWDYFLALDEDLRILRRYIAFHEDNLETFSLELHRIIQMAALEVEAVLLSLYRGSSGGCGGKRSPSFTQLDLRSKDFIRQKWGIEVEDIEVHFLGLGVPLKPLDPQGQPVYPWWDAYTSLKHGRTQALKKATCTAALNLDHLTGQFSQGSHPLSTSSPKRPRASGSPGPSEDACGCTPQGQKPSPKPAPPPGSCTPARPPTPL